MAIRPNQMKQHINRVFFTWKQNSMYPKDTAQKKVPAIQFTPFTQGNHPDQATETIEVTTVNGATYQSLFSHPQPTSHTVLVNKIIWDNILTALPSNYQLPQPDTIKVFETFQAQIYQSLFTNPTANQLVNDQVWEPIRQTVPPSFIIPNPNTTEILQPTSSKDYQSLFTEPSPTTSIYVDTETLTKIVKSLPKEYKLPDEFLSLIDQKVS